jgi:phosphoribosylaminoimidazole-succinocarboxamide synthase
MAEILLSQCLAEMLTDTSNNSKLKNQCYHGLDVAQKKQLAAKDVQAYEGKVRQCVFTGEEMLMVHTDRLTAFDKLISYVPYKGNILTEITNFWFKEIAKTLPCHLIDRTHPRVLKVKKLEPIKAEVIVRGYLAGSMMRAYTKGERSFCGITLPEGLVEYGPLAIPIITPTSKAAVFEHDENKSADELIAEGICTRAEWQQISKLALQIFALGQKIYLERGWILVDTKYEFGRDKAGNIFIIDEVHTPDSSRLWVEKTYRSNLASAGIPDMLDKETVRRELMSKGFSGEGKVPEISTKSLVELAKVYLRVAEGLTGTKMVVDGSGSHVGLRDLGY